MLRMNNVNKSALRGSWRRVNGQVSTVRCMHSTTLVNFSCVSQNNVCLYIVGLYVLVSSCFVKAARSGPVCASSSPSCCRLQARS